MTSVFIFLCCHSSIVHLILMIFFRTLFHRLGLTVTSLSYATFFNCYLDRTGSNHEVTAISTSGSLWRLCRRVSCCQCRGAIFVALLCLLYVDYYESVDGSFITALQFFMSMFVYFPFSLPLHLFSVCFQPCVPIPSHAHVYFSLTHASLLFNLLFSVEFAVAGLLSSRRANISLPLLRIT